MFEQMFFDLINFKDTNNKKQHTGIPKLNTYRFPKLKS